MTVNFATPWHKTSYDLFLQDYLPQLLSDGLPLSGYQAQSTGPYTCRVEITLVGYNQQPGQDGEVVLKYEDLPQPDESGIFMIDGEPRTVVPVAEHEELAEAPVACVGELLREYVRDRIGLAPRDLPWDESLGRVWLPLDTWFTDFLREKSYMLDAASWTGSQGQRLDTTNWISSHTHLRRLIIKNRRKPIAPGQFGRVCPFETPEGPNMARVFTIAVGAEIRDGRIAITDDRPEATLGIGSSMIPFLEQDDPNRLLMGANMMRQAGVPPNPEPALVQTGNEPNDPTFWTGRNLLTAFVTWGPDTVADGIVVSESAARRLDYPYRVEPGDKLANRHGIKGVVSRILPDDQMPHLPDGTPVELVYSFAAMHTRMTFGQASEAVMGRIARAEGEAVIVPPFHAPSVEEMRERLKRAGLPESGMETLRAGANGPSLAMPSLVGYVYWNRLVHLARHKMETATTCEDDSPRLGEPEAAFLLEHKAYENLAEMLNTRSMLHKDGCRLAERLSQGMVEQSHAPTPRFTELARRLAVAGIAMELKDGSLYFSLKEPQNGIRLAKSVPHPWLHESRLSTIGNISQPEMGFDLPPFPEAAYKLLLQTNERLQRLVDKHAPNRLVENASALLEEQAQSFFDELLPPEALQIHEPQLFSGQVVIAPATGLTLEQVGLPDEMAWKLFGPWVERATGDALAVKNRTPGAQARLDEIMAKSWVLLNPVPPYTATVAFVAFRPLRVSEPVVRVHPLATLLLDVDFDGDLVMVLLPVTPAAQDEAGQYLSMKAQISQHPELVKALLPPLDALWGLGWLALKGKGMEAICGVLGDPPAFKEGANQDTLSAALQAILERDGVEAAIGAAERLAEMGFEAAKGSGASLSPFAGDQVVAWPDPDPENPQQWQAQLEEWAEKLITSKDFTNPVLGPQLLSINIRARGRRHLPLLLGPHGVVTDVNGRQVIVRHSLAQGLLPEEMFARMVEARLAFFEVAMRGEKVVQQVLHQREPAGMHALLRARRSARPGIVFARAAANREVEPLEDEEARMFVGA